VTFRGGLNHVPKKAPTGRETALIQPHIKASNEKVIERVIHPSHFHKANSMFYSNITPARKSINMIYMYGLKKKCYNRQRTYLYSRENRFCYYYIVNKQIDIFVNPDLLYQDIIFLNKDGSGNNNRKPDDYYP